MTTRDLNYVIALLLDIALCVCIFGAYFGYIHAHTAINWLVIICIPGLVLGFIRGALS